MRAVAIGSSAEHGSSIRITSGSTAMRPGDAQPLLLPARQAERRRLQPVLDLVPQRRAAQRFLDDVVEFALLRHAGDPWAVGDVVVDALGERVGLLEHHADVAADLRWPTRRGRTGRCRGT